MSKKVSKISVHNLNKKSRLNYTSLRKLAETILEKEKTRAAVNLIFANDSYMKKLNSKFRGKNKTTDVLSFPLESELKRDSVFLGEVYVSLEQARRQAKEYGVSLHKELQCLVAHGVLHLLGYDHQTKKEASEMRKKEEKYLKLTS